MDRQGWHSLTEAVRSVEKPRAKQASYVDIMPTGNEWRDRMFGDELDADEAYAVNTQGYRRDEPVSQADGQMSPPPATPGANRQLRSLYAGGGDPMQSVYNDRLNSTDRFDDYVRRKSLESQDTLNDILRRAGEKVGFTSNEELQAMRDAEREEHLAAVEDLKAVIQADNKMTNEAYEVALLEDLKAEVISTREQLDTEGCGALEQLEILEKLVSNFFREELRGIAEAEEFIGDFLRESNTADEHEMGSDTLQRLSGRIKSVKKMRNTSLEALAKQKSGIKYNK